MKRAIIINADGQFISAVVPKATAPALHVGDRIRVLEKLDLRPYATVAPGNEATVSYVNYDTGVVELELETYHDGLREWRNCILLTPFETDDLLNGLMLCNTEVGCTAA